MKYFYRITEQFRLEGTSGGHLFRSLFKQVCLEQVAKDHVQMTLEDL